MGCFLDTGMPIRYSKGMPGIQVGFLIFTFLSPLLLWVLSRHLESGRFARGICLIFAASLVAAFAGTVAALIRDGTFVPQYALPMQLCDWALVATVIALTLRSQTCFELAYFWGLSGTVQALITPAMDTTTVWRVLGFFVIHSVIPSGVLWLMFEFKMRPRRGAYLRVFLWSEAYLALALLANAFTGANYGFLTGRPLTPSLLDFFSDTHWLYVLQINITGLLLFLVLDLPWQIARRRASPGGKGPPSHACRQIVAASCPMAFPMLTVRRAKASVPPQIRFLGHQDRARTGRRRCHLAAADALVRNVAARECPPPSVGRYEGTRAKHLGKARGTEIIRRNNASRPHVGNSPDCALQCGARGLHLGVRAGGIAGTSRVGASGLGRRTTSVSRNRAARGSLCQRRAGADPDCLRG